MMVVSCLCSDKDVNFCVQNFWLMILKAWSNRPLNGPKTLSGNPWGQSHFNNKTETYLLFPLCEICTAGIKARHAKWLVFYTNQGSGTTSGHCIPYYFTRGLKTLLKNINFLNVNCYILIYLMFHVSQWKVNTKYCVVCPSATVSQGKVLVQFFELQDEQEFFFVEYFYLKE